MTSLPEFILARVSEDEAAAEAALGKTVYGIEDTAADELIEMGRSEGAAVAGYEHFARHDPARVLAQCKAYRAIVEIHQQGVCSIGPAQWCEGCGGEYAENDIAFPCPTLRALAAIWSDHPDYRAGAWAL